jgi:microcystin-dependent protein
MRELIANLPGGRPFRNDDLLMLQAQHNEMWALALADYVATIGGQPHGFVLSGCQLTGAGPTFNLSAGLVYLGGRLCKVAAATNVSTNWFLVMQADDTVDLRSYRDSLHKPCAADYTAVVSPTATAGQPRIALNAIRRLYDLHRFPLGVIQMWWGGALPHGVQLCDGTNGTPDLRSRMPIGHDPGSINSPHHWQLGLTGGQREVPLTVAHIPAHRHFMNRSGGGFAPGGVTIGGFTDYGGVPDTAAQQPNPGSPGDPNSGTGTATTFVGGGQPHNNMPPYVTVGFVMRTV